MSLLELFGWTRSKDTATSTGTGILSGDIRWILLDLEECDRRSVTDKGTEG
jgi:hypothetical protein